MSKIKALIDTNVLIALEDQGQTSPVAAELSRRCQVGGISIYIHPAMREDFSRDRNEVRRLVSTSRMEKYPCLAPIPRRSQAILEAQFGAMRNENDRVDVQLLQALSLDATDILISQDEGIHKRVRGTILEERVLTIADAVGWLRALQDTVDDGVAFVEDVPAYSLDLLDPIFAGLQTDYEEFTEWWRTKCVTEHRACWVLNGRDGLIDGLIVRKSEGGSELGLSCSARLLKLCTFKVASRAQGYKVGELLLRKAVWHAQLNGFDALYLTTFPKQTMLIDLLCRYGFSIQGEKPSGELILAKHLPRDALSAPDGKNTADIVRSRYPRFSVADPVTLFAIPVRWRFHRQLFPEAAKLVPTPLFNDDTIDDREAGRMPGNTIRKVYVCRSKITSMRAGDLLFFYQSKQEVAQHSQMLTTVGVVEQLRRPVGAAELLRLTAGRSVYSRQDLEAMAAASPVGLAVIDFLFIRHLNPPIGLQKMLDSGLIKAPPQSITRIERARLSEILPSMNFGFAI